MNEQYYTPLERDFRVGMIYEIQDRVISDVWRERKIKYASEISFLCMSELPLGRIRIPYLTKEKIEFQGFPTVEVGFKNEIKFTNFPSSEIWSDTRGQCFFTYTNDDRRLLFINAKTGDMTLSGPAVQQIYAGKCRCINDLYTVLDLLRIKI